MTLRGKGKRKNGNGQGSVPDVLAGVMGEPTGGYAPGITDPNYGLDDFTNLDFPSMEKEFLEPGQGESIFMRVVFKETQGVDLRPAVRFMARCKKFNDKRHEDMLRTLLAGTVSINGAGRMQMLMGRTNILATNVLEELLGKRPNGKKDKDPRVYINQKPQPQQENTE